MGMYAGAAIGCSATMTVAIFGCWLWLRMEGNTEMTGPTLFRVCSAIATSLFLYLGPNSAGAAMTVFFHGDKAIHYMLAIGTFVLNVGTAMFLFRNILVVAPMCLTTVPEDDSGEMVLVSSKSGGGCWPFFSSTAPMKFVFEEKATSNSTTMTSTTSSSSSSSDEDDHTTSTDSTNSARGPNNQTDETGRHHQEVNRVEELRRRLTGKAWWFLALYGPLFDGTRDFHKPTVRGYIIPEFLSSCLVQIIVGIRPDSGCEDAAWAVVFISGAMLAYLVLLRPYRTRLDMCFSIILNFLQVCLSLFTIIAVNTFRRQQSHFSIQAIEIILYALLVSYFVQMFVQAYWAYHCQERRRRLEEQAFQHRGHHFLPNDEECEEKDEDEEMIRMGETTASKMTKKSRQNRDPHNAEEEEGRDHRHQDEEQQSKALNVPLLHQTNNPLER